MLSIQMLLRWSGPESRNYTSIFLVEREIDAKKNFGLSCQVGVCVRWYRLKSMIKPSLHKQFLAAWVPSKDIYVLVCNMPKRRPLYHWSLHSINSS